MTGHKGLIGTFLLKKLEEEKHRPLLLIDKRAGKNLSEFKKIKLNEKADVFIHLASFCKISETIKNPQLAFKNNVLGIFTVLEFCRKNKIPKIIFTSSSRILSKEKNPYTASKIYSEELIKSYHQCYKINYLIIRPSTVYGPFDDKTRRIIDIFILNALKGKELKIFGNKEKTLDFTYIDDFINGLMIVINKNNTDFNIGSGKETKVSYVADFIIKLAGKGKKKFYPPQITQPQKVKIDISTIKNLGFRPKVSIEEGLTQTFNWYKKNLKKIKR